MERATDERRPRREAGHRAEPVRDGDDGPRPAPLTRTAGSFLRLTKPRITGLVAVTAGAGYLIAGRDDPSLLRLAALLAGTALSAGGTNALNQWWERGPDGRMERTRDRPLPAGEIVPVLALVFGTATAAAGVAVLAAGTTALTAFLAAVTVLAYVTVYTPLKRSSPICTYVGAVPGALPVLGGWAAAGQGLSAIGWAFFGLVALWQLPHFFALDWLARSDYRKAGFATLAVRDPSGDRSARHALAATLALAPASLVPMTDPAFGVLYGAVAGGGLLLLLVPAGLFLAKRSRGRARRLFGASLLYLPVLLAAAVVDALAGGG